MKMLDILRAKCIIAGESTVGKSAIAQMFLTNGTNFPKNYSMTCGIELLTRSVSIPESKDIVEFYMYDSSGKDVYVESLLKYWEKPDLLILVFDITNEASLQQCEKWFQLIQTMVGRSPLPGVLLGNKVDQTELRVVEQKTGMEFAAKLGLQYFECSAKEAKGIDEPFLFLAGEFRKSRKMDV